LGRNYGGAATNTEDIENIIAVLQDEFVISPLLLFVPAIVLLLVIRRIPAVPALGVGVVLGFLTQIYVQEDSLAYAVSVLQEGYVLETSNEMVDELLNSGGLDSMMYTVSLVMVAMTFGGALEYSGILEALMKQLLKIIKGTGGLIASTLGTCVFTNVTCSDQYISIVVPSRMFVQAYKDHGLQSKNLSRALEDGGTITSVFVPWNTCGVFIYGTLGVSAFSYAPYAVLNYSVPFISLFFAFTGITIAKIATTSKMGEI